MSHFTETNCIYDYIRDIQKALNIFNIEGGEYGMPYINGLFSKFEFLRKEAKKKLTSDLREIKPQGKEILMPYLAGVIDEITRIASEKTIKMQEIERDSNIAEAMNATFCRLYSNDGGKIKTLIIEAINTIDDAMRKSKDEQLDYECQWFIKKLPNACWPPVLKLW